MVSVKTIGYKIDFLSNNTAESTADFFRFYPQFYF